MRRRSWDQMRILVLETAMAMVVEGQEASRSVVRATAGRNALLEDAGCWKWKPHSRVYPKVTQRQKCR